MKKPFAGASTWLCTFTVMADMPTDLTAADMEGAVAQGLAVYFQGLGLPANVSAQLVATAGNVTLLNPTEQKGPALGTVNQKGPTV